MSETNGRAGLRQNQALAEMLSNQNKQAAKAEQQRKKQLGKVQKQFWGFFVICNYNGKLPKLQNNALI